MESKKVLFAWNPHDLCFASERPCFGGWPSKIEVVGAYNSACRDEENPVGHWKYVRPFVGAPEMTPFFTWIGSLPIWYRFWFCFKCFSPPKRNKGRYWAKPRIFVGEPSTPKKQTLHLNWAKGCYFPCPGENSNKISLFASFYKFLHL